MVSVSHDILDSLNNLMPQVKWLFDVIVKWFMERIMPPAAPDAPDVLIQHTGGLSVVFTWPATNPKHLSASHRRDLLESIVRAALRSTGPVNSCRRHKLSAFATLVCSDPPWCLCSVTCAVRGFPLVLEEAGTRKEEKVK
jgi:hypothetical protein